MKFPDIGGGRSSGPSSGSFIKMKSGDRIQGMFRGDPSPFKQHWVNNRSVICPGKDNCQHCAGGDKPKFRFRINFVTQENGAWVAKVFDGNYGTFKLMKEMHESDYNLEETYVTVSRSGEKNDTRYSILPVKNNGGLKAADIKAIMQIELIPLTQEAAATGADESDDEDSEDIPF
jgi:hypothetical protein